MPKSVYTRIYFVFILGFLAERSFRARYPSERSKRIEEDRRWTMGAAATNGGGGGDDSSDDDDVDGDDDEEGEDMEMDADDLAEGLGGFSMAGGGGEEEDEAAGAGRSRRAAMEPDEDGWCTVPTKGGRR